MESNPSTENLLPPKKTGLSRRSFFKLMGAQAGSLACLGILEVTSEKVFNRWLIYELITGARTFLFENKKDKNGQSDEIVVDMPVLDQQVPDLFVASSSAKCGLAEDCNMGIMWSGKEKAYQHRQVFLNYVAKQLNVPESPQVDKLIYMIADGKHGPTVVTKDQLTEGKPNVFETESLILQAPGKFIGFQPIDCSGITMVDPKSKTIAVIHGNKYLNENQMIKKTVDQLQAMGINTEDLLVWIGPGARKLELGNSITNAFKAGEAVKTFDLLDSYKKLLAESGINSQNIEVSAIDTVKDTNFYSGHAATHLISPEGNRLPLPQAAKNFFDRYFGNHLLVAGFSK